MKVLTLRLVSYTAMNNIPRFLQPEGGARQERKPWVPVLTQPPRDLEPRPPRLRVLSGMGQPRVLPGGHQGESGCEGHRVPWVTAAGTQGGCVGTAVTGAGAAEGGSPAGLLLLMADRR